MAIPLLVQFRHHLQLCLKNKLERFFTSSDLAQSEKVEVISMIKSMFLKICWTAFSIILSSFVSKTLGWQMGLVTRISI